VIRHDTRRVPACVRAVLTIILVVAASATRASGVQCGAAIVEDVTLDQDLTCTAGGLTVGADGIKIDLRGHSITGAGTGAGITIIRRTDVTIFGGTIKASEFVANTARGIMLFARTTGGLARYLLCRRSTRRLP
jgi:hypothetical protein